MSVSQHISEADFQASVVAMARAYGWMVHGVLEQRNYAKRLSSGFPDLVLARNYVVYFWELKSEKGVVSPAQKEWFAHIYTRVFRPSDMDEIEEMLK